MINLLIDNDVLIKCACYSLLTEIRSNNPDTTAVGVLGAARFVVRGYLERKGAINDRQGALRRFNDYLATVEELEPTRQELDLATHIEEMAAQLGLDLDSGEAQLCAIAIKRGGCLLLTGDKRAISGAEKLQDEVSSVSRLRGRLVCLEQAVRGVVERLGATVARSRVCAEPAIDKSLSICFSCSSGAEYAFDTAGLASYISALRGDAPDLLYAPEFL